MGCAKRGFFPALSSQLKFPLVVRMPWRGLTGDSVTQSCWSFEFCPTGKPPVSRNRQSAMSNLRATATIPNTPQTLATATKALSKPTTPTHSQAGNAPNSRPTPWSSSAHAGYLTW